jgi:hypothetical protein
MHTADSQRNTRDPTERRIENVCFCFPPVSVYGGTLLARLKHPLLITNGAISGVHVEFCAEIDHSSTTNFIPTYVLKQQYLEIRRGTFRLGLYWKISHT